MPVLFLDWGELAAFGSVLSGVNTYDAGGVEVSVEVAGETEGDIGVTVPLDGFAADGEPFSTNSHLKLFGDGLSPDGTSSAGDVSTTTISFASSDPLYGDEVNNVTFRINDIDGAAVNDTEGGAGADFEDIVTIRAYDADGNLVPVTLTPGGIVTLSGSTATGDGDGSATSPDHSLLVTIPGPVARVEIDYDNGEGGEQNVLVSDIYFDTIDSDNDDPDAVDDSETTDLDTPIIISVLGNDTDPDSDPLTVIGTTDPANGSITVNADGTVTYTPDTGFTGEDTFTYTISDGNGGEDTATVTVTVNDDPNTDPDAVDDSETTGVDTPVIISVLGNDTDPESDPLSITGTTDPANGSITVNADGTVTYTPDTGFTGEDTFTYTISDGNGGEDTATVTVTVNDDPNTDPDAVDDSETTGVDTPVIISVLGNDTDPESDPLSITGTTDPANGSITVNADGTVTYTPDTGFTGEDTFTYTISDGNGGEDTATVTVTVNDDPNTDPDAVDDSETTGVDTPVIISVLGNDTDPESDPLSITGTTDPANGSITVNADGTVTYTPDTGFTGEDTFTYTISDGNGGEDTATVTVTVSDDPNSDPDAIDDARTTDFNEPIIIDVLTNDTDPESDPLSVTDTTDPSNGTIVVNPNGEIVYTPNDGFSGEDTFTYTISDGNGGTDTATVTVTVSPQPNQPPFAIDDAETTDFNEPVIINVLENDGDPDSDPISVTDASDGSNGTTTVNADGTITYTPNDGFSGEDTFTYTITDGNGGTDTATVTVTIEPNDPPVATDDSEETLPDEAVIISVLDNDSDPNSDPLTITGTTDPDNGTITVNGDGTITYTPDPGFVGNDTFTYTITDGNGGTDTATVSVDVTQGRIDTDIFPVDPSLQPIDPFNTFDEDEDPFDDLDSVEGTTGDDLIRTGDDADTIIALDGDDTIFSGIDDDVVEGRGGNDYIEDIQGADTIGGGSGDDTILAGVNTFSDYAGDDTFFAAGNLGDVLGFDADPNQEDGRDFITGGVGNDSILTGDDRDTIDAGADNDYVDAGIDDDSVFGANGDDTLIGSHGSDTIDGGQGDDFIDASNFDALEIADADDLVPENDRDSVLGGAGNDTIITGDDADYAQGDQGDDLIDLGIDDDSGIGGSGSDTLLGGDGNDTLNGGEDADSIVGGADQDVIVVSSAEEGFNDTVDGSAEGVDFDVLDLTGVGVRGEDWRLVNTSTDSNGNGLDGTVEFLDDTGAVTGSLVFTEIEQIVPCFTPGTAIATPTGQRLVENLKVGDRVITRDNGLQEIRWIGKKELTGHQLARLPHLKPILIQAGSLGPNLPEQDMLVSPNHRVLVNNDKTALYFEEREVLASAKHLTGLEGVDEVGTLGVTYLHFMFDQHEVVLSNGAWTESFQPGDYTMAGMGNAQRNEIFELFPELKTKEGLQDYNAARRSLKKHEALLVTQ